MDFELIMDFKKSGRAFLASVLFDASVIKALSRKEARHCFFFSSEKALKWEAIFLRFLSVITVAVVIYKQLSRSWFQRSSLGLT